VNTEPAIEKENASAKEIAAAKSCAPTKEGFVRFQALEQISQGASKSFVAKLSNRCVRTIERWIAAFNARGIDGLALKGRPGRPRLIEAEKFAAEYVPILLDPSLGKESHWTALKFHGYLNEEFKELISYRTLLRYMEENSIALRYPRRWPSQQKEELREAFLGKFKEIVAETNNSVWFGDEVGFEGDPRPRRIWVKKGSKPKVPYLGNHLRHNAIGAVNAGSGQLFSLVVPHADSVVFQVFLDEFAKHVSKTEPDKQTILILDNASWHKNSSLNWHQIVPVFLPPYSPDLNPIETIWKVLGDRFFTQWFAKTLPELIERICTALTSLSSKEISSVAAISHLLNK